jgi:hypothetical protein
MERLSWNHERRAHARFDHISPVCIKNAETGNLCKARILNYSENGLYFESDSYLESGTPVYIAIKVSPFKREETDYDCYRASIIWRKESDDSFFYNSYGAQLHSTHYEKILGATELLHQEEQRKHKRKKADVPVNISVRDKLLTWYSKDISKSGMFIKSSAELNVGEILYLSVPEANGRLTLATGRIVWSNGDGFGIKFVTSDHSSIG